MPRSARVAGTAVSAPANPWGVSFRQGLFNMTSDSRHFRRRGELEKQGFELVGNRYEKGGEAWLPLYEAKMIHQFDHRFATYDDAGAKTRELEDGEKADPAREPLPRYWVPQAEVEERLAKKGWTRGWLMGWRDICRATDERTVIASLVPRVGCGHTMPLMFPETPYSLTDDLFLVANLNCLVLDYIARIKVGGTHLTYNYLKQLPVLPAEMYGAALRSVIIPRIFELTYTSWSMKPFADDLWREADDELRVALVRQREEAESEWRAASGEERMANGERRMAALGSSSPKEVPSSPSRPGSERADTSPSSSHSPFATHHSPDCPLAPFPWNPDRRARLRAELDALYARLYGLTRKQLRYILDPADLTPKELEDILDPFEEVEDPLDEEGYRRRREASDWPSETFRVLRDNEEKRYGHYRTRHLVLEAWDGKKHDLAHREVPGLRSKGRRSFFSVSSVVSPST